MGNGEAWNFPCLGPVLGSLEKDALVLVLGRYGLM